MGDKGLEGSVEKEGRKIPANLFKGRDFIPFYGIGPSLWRWAGELVSGEDYKLSTKIARTFSRVAELGVVCSYNISLILIYNAIAN